MRKARLFVVKKVVCCDADREAVPFVPPTALIEEEMILGGS